jgi:hypothetical protein
MKSGMHIIPGADYRNILTVVKLSRHTGLRFLDVI